MQDSNPELFSEAVAKGADFLERGVTAPANIASNKLAMLWLWRFGPGDADVMALNLVEP